MTSSELDKIPSDYSEGSPSPKPYENDGLQRTQTIHPHSDDAPRRSSDTLSSTSTIRNVRSTASSVRSPLDKADSEAHEETPSPVNRRGVTATLQAAARPPRSASLQSSLAATTTEKKSVDSSIKHTNESSSSRKNFPAAVRPVIAPRGRPRPRDPPNVDHVLKSNSRVNMSFDNKRFWDISSANRNLAERIQTVKPTYSRTPEQPKFYRSKMDLKQTTGFFTLQRDNTRIANRIMLAKPTVPVAPGRSSSVSRIPSSRPSSSWSRATFDIASRPPSASHVAPVSMGRNRASWKDNL
ncbi:hypothetical protein BV898_18055 [Hypsibius exemplaris]|uniref:Uncharacterized protein n=1 Tax=Hypsibius exemplaris TaxID=2072580 RepID=A0A9X6NJB9_HYPEX|nr:hypothetical protein BV898_18055 [Hypsibius exemplaris]